MALIAGQPDEMHGLGKNLRGEMEGVREVKQDKPPEYITYRGHTYKLIW